VADDDIAFATSGDVNIAHRVVGNGHVDLVYIQGKAGRDRSLSQEGRPERGVTCLRTPLQGNANPVRRRQVTAYRSREAHYGSTGAALGR